MTTHVVGRVRFELTVAEREEAYPMQAQVSSMWPELERRMSEAFDAVADDNVHLVIPELVLDLGRIAPERLPELLLEALRSALQERAREAHVRALADAQAQVQAQGPKVLGGAWSARAQGAERAELAVLPWETRAQGTAPTRQQASRASPRQRDLELAYHFLMHGYPPWGAPSDWELDAGLERLARAAPVLLSELLSVIALAPAAVQRLAWQVSANNETLWEQWSPGFGTWPASWQRFAERLRLPLTVRAQSAAQVVCAARLPGGPRDEAGWIKLALQSVRASAVAADGLVPTIAGGGMNEGPRAPLLPQLAALALEASVPHAWRTALAQVSLGQVSSSWRAPTAGTRALASEEARRSHDGLFAEEPKGARAAPDAPAIQSAPSESAVRSGSPPSPSEEHVARASTLEDGQLRTAAADRTSSSQAESEDLAERRSLEGPRHGGAFANELSRPDDASPGSLASRARRAASAATPLRAKAPLVAAGHIASEARAGGPDAAAPRAAAASGTRSTTPSEASQREHEGDRSQEAGDLRLVPAGPQFPSEAHAQVAGPLPRATSPESSPGQPSGFVAELREPVVRGSNHALLLSSRSRLAGGLPAVVSPAAPADAMGDIEGTLALPTAGLVLVWPYLVHYFSAVGLRDETGFQADAQERAVHLLHYLATGECAAREQDLPLAKLLCGWPLARPLAREFEVGELEQRETQDVLSAVITHWGRLGSTSVAGFRGSFLCRPGQLRLRASDALLRVERCAYDVLLDRLPWNISVIKLSWMAHPLHVEW